MIKPQWDWSKYNGNLKWLPSNTSKLPNAPDVESIDKWLVEVLERFYGTTK